MHSHSILRYISLIKIYSNNILTLQINPHAASFMKKKANAKPLIESYLRILCIRGNEKVNEVNELKFDRR